MMYTIISLVVLIINIVLYIKSVKSHKQQQRENDFILKVQMPTPPLQSRLDEKKGVVEINIKQDKISTASYVNYKNAKDLNLLKVIEAMQTHTNYLKDGYDEKKRTLGVRAERLKVGDVVPINSQKE
jgi:heme exporter protein D